MKKKFIAFAFFAILLIASASCSGQSAGDISFPFDQYDYSLSNVKLGIAFPPGSDTEQREFTAEHMSALGVNQLRIDQKWSLREPARDSFYWTPLENRLNFFYRENLDVLMTLELKEFPQWTSTLSDSEIEDEFREYVRELMAKYGDKIRYIQFGNEWNWEIDCYLYGNDDLFISLANILYDEVISLPDEQKPIVLSGSLSIGGVMALAYAQGRIENVIFEKGALIDPDDFDPVEITEEADRISAILGSISFDAVDLHFYDDYWNWPTYLESLKKAMENQSKDPESYDYIASEFGGPHPDLEAEDESFKAERLISYIQTLDRMELSDAFYFKMIEASAGSTIAHPNSYLISKNLKTGLRYEIMSRFGNANR